MLACLDLEGVLIPEIWVNVAEKTGIDALLATTREVPVYRDLMAQRLRILDEHGLGIHEIQEVIAELTPLDGARDYLEWLKERFEVVILSDTFYEFAAPLMRQLGFPTLFCHSLQIHPETGRIEDFKLRMEDQKRAAVKAFHGLNFQVIASGDSYNDVTMLSEADAGILFCPPQKVIEEFPQYPVVTDYDQAREAFLKAKAAIESGARS